MELLVLFLAILIILLFLNILSMSLYEKILRNEIEKLENKLKEKDLYIKFLTDKEGE